jgi:hypothetical protein
MDANFSDDLANNPGETQNPKPNISFWEPGTPNSGSSARNDFVTGKQDNVPDENRDIRICTFQADETIPMVLTRKKRNHAFSVEAGGKIRLWPTVKLTTF